MLLLYYMILSVLELSITLSMLYDCVTCDCDGCGHTVICVTIIHDIISHPLLKSKIKKSEK